MMNVSRVLLMTAVVATILITLSASEARTLSVSHGELTGSTAIQTANRWASFVSNSDVEGLDRLLNNQYLHIHATGLVETKNRFIEALKSGARKYEPIKIQDESAHVFGDCAIVTGKFNLKVLSRGKIIEGVNRISLLITKAPLGLQVAYFQATSIPEK
jgi:ketosteroid isomerase-like protein